MWRGTRARPGRRAPVTVLAVHPLRPDPPGRRAAGPPVRHRSGSGRCACRSGCTTRSGSTIRSSTSTTTFAGSACPPPAEAGSWTTSSPTSSADPSTASGRCGRCVVVEGLRDDRIAPSSPSCTTRSSTACPERPFWPRSSTSDPASGPSHLCPHGNQVPSRAMCSCSGTGRRRSPISRGWRSDAIRRGVGAIAELGAQNRASAPWERVRRLRSSAPRGRRLNGTISSRRRFASLSMPLADAKLCGRSSDDGQRRRAGRCGRCAPPVVAQTRGVARRRRWSHWCRSRPGARGVSRGWETRCRECSCRWLPPSTTPSNDCWPSQRGPGSPRRRLVSPAATCWQISHR